MLSAAQRGHDVVVVDLPRTVDPLVDEVVARCDRLLVVVVPTRRGRRVGGPRLCAGYPDPTLGAAGAARRGRRARATSRGPPACRCSRAMADQRGLAEAIDLGLGPVRSRRGTLGRAGAEVLDQLLARSGPAA